MEGDTPEATSPLEGQTLPTAFLTFDIVEDRLVEAMLTCWRDADRERGWLRIRSHWPDVLREQSAGDYDARGGDASSSEVSIRPASLTRREVAEMEEAFAWAGLLDPQDRKVVGLAIEQLARGRREVKWGDVVRRMGLARGSDGVRKRYSRAIEAICVAKNGSFAWDTRVNRDDLRS